MQKSLFSIEQTNGWEYEKFKMSRWGKLHSVIPWEALETLLPEKKSSRGPAPYFDRQGMFALMFLKHETGLSDEKLIESINHNTSQQLFCGMRLGHLELIRDTGIVSRVRGYLGQYLDLDEFQKELVKYWKADIEHPHFVKMDAYCVESYIRYPTDVKLLWECSIWAYEQLFLFRKLLGQRLGKPKERYTEQVKKQLVYSQYKRKPYKKKRKRLRSLLAVLRKGLYLLLDLLREEEMKLGVGLAFYKRLSTAFTILDQQQSLFDTPGSKVKHRIVSFHKPYLRPIKRGKPAKPTEFGAKLHILQVDGLCVIEQYSQHAFHEGNRLQSTVKFHQQLFGECHQLAADKIYATNKNRKYCTAKGIQTSFVAKGRKPPKEIRQLKATLGKERATRLEGAFGNHKNHYLLDKVKALNQHTEKVWIFFGIFTANARWVMKKRAHVERKVSQGNTQLTIAA